MSPVTYIASCDLTPTLCGAQEVLEGKDAMQMWYTRGLCLKWIPRILADFFF